MTGANWSVVARSLLVAAKAQRAEARQAEADWAARYARPNPRPAGVIQSGSATDAVWQLMKDAPRRQWRRAQLVLLTGRSESAIDWALLYLRAQGLVRVVNPELARNLRYAVAVKG